MSYLGLALVLLLLWPSVGFVRATWRENRRGALGVAVYTALALAFAVYQFFLR